MTFLMVLKMNKLCVADIGNYIQEVAHNSRFTHKLQMFKNET